MKTPTLEEVKKYFKDAKNVRSSDLPIHYELIMDISDRSIFDERQIHFSMGAYWLCKKEIENLMLWSSEKGYAEIIDKIS